MIIFIYILGAELHHLNNERKSAYDLAKNPQTASLLHHVTRPTKFIKGYGDDEDSD